jgi:uncharacterized protein
MIGSKRRSPKHFSKRRTKPRKRLCQVALIIFLLLNLLSYLGVYGFTHFKSPGQLGFGLPRPTSATLPADFGLPYVTRRIPVNQQEWLETWLIPAPNASNASAQGTVLLFPGKGNSKGSQLLGPAQVLHALGYNLLLTDFRGVGGSSGNTSTLGIREAKDVAMTVQYAQAQKLPSPLILYGVSMGSVAALKAAAQEKITVDALILELPFARLLDVVRGRFFAIAEMMVFWGSVQHGVNGFTHNPATYASQIHCPTLLLHGQLDKWTSTVEIRELFRNLKGVKQLVIFPNAGHQLLVAADKKLWRRTVDEFLTAINS